MISLVFTDRVLALVKENGITKNKLLTELGLGKNSFVDWEERGNAPNGATVSKIATYFNVTTDYLLGLSNVKSPLEIPEILKNVPVAFHRGEFEDLTQEEVDNLAIIAASYKATRNSLNRGES